jgi:hypothetical protein
LIHNECCLWGECAASAFCSEGREDLLEYFGILIFHRAFLNYMMLHFLEITIVDVQCDYIAGRAGMKKKNPEYGDRTKKITCHLYTIGLCGIAAELRRHASL